MSLRCKQLPTSCDAGRSSRVQNGGSQTEIAYNFDYRRDTDGIPNPTQVLLDLQRSVLVRPLFERDNKQHSKFKSFPLFDDRHFEFRLTALSSRIKRGT